MILVLPKEHVKDVRNQLLFSLNEEEITESIAQNMLNRLGF